LGNGAKKRSQAQQSRREVGGVVLIALGLFLGVCLYFKTAGLLGAAITAALFGLGGVFAYVLPFVFIASGILFIALAASKPKRGRAALIVAAAFLLLALLHLSARPVIGQTAFFAYVRDAYLFGKTDFSGGGAFGALICYPLLLLTGEAGAYIFLIAGILIILLLVTRLSLREAGQQVGSKVKAGLEYVSKAREKRKMLYTESIDDQEEQQAISPAVRRGRRPMKEAQEDITFMPSEGLIQKRTSFSKDYTPNIIEQSPDLNYVSAEPDDFASAPLRTARRAYMERERPPFNTCTLNVEPAQPELVQAEHFPEHESIPYMPPSFSLLNPPSIRYGHENRESPAEKGRLLVETLQNFNVSARIVNISVGPVITRYELAPAPGVRVNRITALADDIALALAAPRVRIEAPIPGKSAVGIEIPNKDTATVVLRDIVESREFINAKSPVTLALGKDIAGKIIVADLSKMPHLLIAGATGSGKSVCINDIIISLVYKCTPLELQLILVDPKVVELSAFGVLPHLRVPVVVDPKKAAGALAGGVREMTERYQLFAKSGARDIERYNELADEGRRLPKLVIIIDELADLMMVAPDTVEDSICRIAQLGRAAGIHLIVATQRPSTDVITGLIKANIPSRIAFAVASAIDSRIILDASGAEKLLGRGDMLFHPNGAGKPTRLQCAFVSDEEVERVVRHFQAQALKPEYDEQLLEEMETEQTSSQQGFGKQEDELLGEAVRIVLDSGQASISMIQRRLRVGYARAARLVDIMEQHGYVSGFDGSKPRKLLITRSQYEQVFAPRHGESLDE